MNKQNKPRGQKVFLDEQYNTNQTERTNKRNQTVPRFNQDEYTTEEESFVPNTRILKNDYQGTKSSALAGQKIKFKRPMSINLSDKKLRTPRVGAANNNSLVHAGDDELDESQESKKP